MYLRPSPPPHTPGGATSSREAERADADQEAGTARSREDHPAPWRRKPMHGPRLLWPALWRLIAGRSPAGGPSGSMLPRDVVFGLRSMFVTLTIGVGGSVALIAIANSVDRRISPPAANPIAQGRRMWDSD